MEPVRRGWPRLRYPGNPSDGAMAISFCNRDGVTDISQEQARLENDKVDGRSKYIEMVVGLAINAWEESSNKG